MKELTRQANVEKNALPDAGLVLDYSPDLVPDVLAGRMGLQAAADVAREKKRSALLHSEGCFEVDVVRGHRDKYLEAQRRHVGCGGACRKTRAVRIEISVVLNWRSRRLRPVRHEEHANAAECGLGLAYVFADDRLSVVRKSSPRRRGEGVVIQHVLWPVQLALSK